MVEVKEEVAASHENGKNEGDGDVAGNVVDVVDDGDEVGEETTIPVVEATPLFQTTLRQKITPYLPPPVVVAMRRIDPQLEPYIGPEPSITILSSITLALLLWQLLVVRTAHWRQGGSAIAGDDDDDEYYDGMYNNKSKKGGTDGGGGSSGIEKHYDSTILFCGPSFAGKTSLFYHLLYPNKQFGTDFGIWKTVKSIKANSDVYIQPTHSNGAVPPGGYAWRLVDVPGHLGATKVVSNYLLPKSNKKQQSQKLKTIVVVLDSTQTVAKASDYLYAVLRQLHNNNKNTINVIVACNKCKASKAKNVRRLKLQLRTELERLDKLQKVSNNNGDGDGDDDYDIMDWNQLLNDTTKVQFVSTSCDPIHLNELYTTLGFVINNKSDNNINDGTGNENSTTD